MKKRGAGESRKQGSKEFQVSVMISDTSSPLFRDTNATSNAKCSHRFTKYDEVSGKRLFLVGGCLGRPNEEVEHKQP